MRDLKGCLHVHSTLSDGDDTIDEILAAARDSGLDFVVLTDHCPVPESARGLEGWHDGVLLAVGVEVKAGLQHCVALGVHDLNGTDDVAAHERLERIKRDGGLVFVAHPSAVRKPLFRTGAPPWTDWSLDSFDGIEIWPYLHDWIRDLRLTNFLSHYRHPDRWISGPEAAILERWDTLGRRRRVVGIGALDNHARRVPFRRFGPALLNIFPHRMAFQTVRTHVLADQPLSGEGQADVAQLYELLAQGRCYVSYDLLADATGFRFEGQRHGERVRMGDEVPAGAPVELRADAPADATLRLLHDGKPIAAAEGRHLAAQAAEPGVYRVEARLGGRPWVFSNPIYLRERASGI